MDTEMKLDVTVVNRDGKRNYFKCVGSTDMKKVQAAVSTGDGFVLHDANELVAYAPGSVLRVGVVESKETKEAK